METEVVMTETDVIKEQIKMIDKLKADHKVMSTVLEMYKDTPLPDVFGDPYYFAQQALERRKVK